ncbi:MAG: alpha/beta hydrolase, partial [Pseudomonadota bacterium]
MPESSAFEVRAGTAALAGERSGQGRSLICLHAGVADRRMYREQTRALSAHLDVLSYDRRGFGETRTLDERFNHVADLSSVMDAAHIKRAIVLGCSQGGRVAIDFALAHPERVDALVLIASAVSGAPSAPMPDDIQALMDELDTAEELEDLTKVNAVEAHMWLDGPRSSEGRVTGPIRDLFLDMNRIALEHPPLTKERQPNGAYDQLDTLKVPALLLHGTLDFPHIAARHQHMAAVMPDAEAA